MSNVIVHQEFDPKNGVLSFYTYEVLTKLLHDLVETHPQLAQIESIGKSLEGRELWLVTLTNQHTGPAHEKAAYWIDGNTHAGEVTGSTVVLYTIWSYLTKYGSDEAITHLLDRYAVYLLPRISVDGAERYLTTPYFLRSSTRPYPYQDERDGLYPEDIDGDGQILDMRIKDPNGAWKPSSKDPRIMRRREIDEEGGEYYHLMNEGLIRNFDGYTIPIAPRREGLDINRNYPYEWAPEGTEHGAGPYPLSEPETHAEAEFWRTHPNISGFLTYHTYSGVLLRPYSTHPDEQMPPEDLEVFKVLGERGTQITGYPCVSTYHGFRYHPKEVTHGAMDDYAYDHLGWFGFTTELWDMVTEAGIKGDKPRDFIAWFNWHPEEDDLKLMQWNDEVMHGEAFQPWKPFNHPQLGPVEIGGWKFKLYEQNAPLQYLPDLCEKHSRFTLSHASISPRLGIRHLKVESQGSDVFHLVVVVENNGFLPTYTSKKAQEREIVRPLEVELELPEGVTLVSGQRRHELGQLEGRSNKLFGGGTPTDNLCKAEWVLKGAAGVQVKLTVRSPRAGVVHKTVVLVPSSL